MLQANITSGSAEISLTHSQVIMDRMDRTPSREFLPEIKELKASRRIKLCQNQHLRYIQMQLNPKCSDLRTIKHCCTHYQGCCNQASLDRIPPMRVACSFPPKRLSAFPFCALVERLQAYICRAEGSWLDEHIAML